MNVATFLGQEASPPNAQAWGSYIEGLRNRVVNSWADAKGAYLALKYARETLGLPFVTGGGEAEDPGALTEGQNQLFLDLGAAGDYLIRYADEALAGKRTVGWVEGEGDLGFEALPSDTVKVKIFNSRTVVVDKNTGQPVPVSGSLSGVPVLVWVGFAAAVVAIGATYLINADNNETARVLAEKKFHQTVTNAEKAAIDAGATPEEAAKIGQSIFQGATQLKKAEAAKVKEEKKPGEWPATIKTVAWIGLGIASLYVAGRLIPVIAR